MVVAALLVANQSDAEEFDYVDRFSNTVTTTHEVAYTIKISEPFQSLGELHHRQESNGHMFRVSFAAFANGSDIILIHAETLEDASGMLNYHHLPAGEINGVTVGLREQCLPMEAEASLAGNREALFVKDQGFKLQLPFLLMQHLIASENGNAELVLSYGRHVENCAEISTAFRSEIQARIARAIELEPIPD